MMITFNFNQNCEKERRNCDRNDENDENFQKRKQKSSQEKRKTISEEKNSWILFGGKLQSIFMKRCKECSN